MRPMTAPAPRGARSRRRTGRPWQRPPPDAPRRWRTRHRPPGRGSARPGGYGGWAVPGGRGAVTRIADFPETKQLHFPRDGQAKQSRSHGHTAGAAPAKAPLKCPHFARGTVRTRATTCGPSPTPTISDIRRHPLGQRRGNTIGPLRTMSPCGSRCRGPRRGGSPYGTSRGSARAADLPEEPLLVGEEAGRERARGRTPPSGSAARRSARPRCAAGRGSPRDSGGREGSGRRQAPVERLGLGAVHVRSSAPEISSTGTGGIARRWPVTSAVWLRLMNVQRSAVSSRSAPGLARYSS
ncbi:hypothetical protein SAVIM40S_07700 [Streptomyces avidinii]